MDSVKENYKHQAESIIKGLEKRNMEGHYFETAKECVEEILKTIPEGSSIANGGSETLGQTGLMEAIKSGKYNYIDRTAGKTHEEEKEIYGKIAVCDYFLMSTNAITLDGELINIDGRGSRVAYLIHGPENVIVIAGMNKVVSDVESGYKRVKDIASPPNCVRLGRKTPCAVTGKCGDCFGQESICSQIVITRRSTVPKRIKVFLIGEDFGF